MQEKLNEFENKVASMDPSVAKYLDEEKSNNRRENIKATFDFALQKSNSRRENIKATFDLTLEKFERTLRYEKVLKLIALSGDDYPRSIAIGLINGSQSDLAIRLF